MLGQVRRVGDGQRRVLEHAGDNPYTRAMTGRGPVVAYLTDDVVAWTGPGLWGPVACAVGPLDPAARLLGRLRADGSLGDIRWLHLPLATAAQLAPHLSTRRLIRWEFRWLAGPPPAAHPWRDRVVPLTPTDEADVDALLDAELPDSSARPGSPMVRAWYGVRGADGGLIACAADETHAGIGFLGGIAVAGAHQGRGYGTALTVTLTRLLTRQHGSVALGVMADNTGAIALYDRLGFTGLVPRSSVEIA